MYISSSPHETKVAVLEDDQLVEVYFERDTDVGLVGGIYKGRVNRVLPGMQSAFVDIGLDRDAFLYVSDFYEDQEEYDKVFEEAEARATKFTTQQTAAPAAPAASAVAEPSPAPAEVAPAPVSPPVATPAVEVPVATVEPPIPVAAPPASKEPHDRRPFDRGRGRRRRHRGRPEFGDSRPGEYRFTPANRPDEAPTESYSFEVLPGESLAKYSHPSSAPTEVVEGGTSESSMGYDATDAASEPTPQDNLSLEGVPPVEASAATVETDNKLPIDAPPVPESVVAPSEVVAEVTRETTRDQPRDEDTVIVSDTTVPFTPAVIYPATPSVAAETAPTEGAEVPALTSATPSQASPVEAPAHEPASAVAKTEPAIEIPAPSESSVAKEVASDAPQEIAGAASGEGQADQVVEIVQTEKAVAPADAAAAESRSEHAELAVPEDEGEEEEFEEDEKLAIAFEGQLDDQTELPAEVAAGTEGEGQPAGQEVAPGAPPAGEAPGAPGDRTYTLREPSQRPRFAPRRRRGRRGMGGDRGPRRFDKPRESTRSGGNHHPVQIAEVLKEGQEILVQIAKEPLGTKGARITSHVALPGRYLVFMPTIEHIGVSRKISSEEERLRLRNIILENKGTLTGGFIVRTAGQGRSEEEFKADLKFLSTLWADIRAKSDRLKAPALIHRDLDLVQRLLRDLLTPDFKCVRVDSEIDYERVLDFVSRCQPALVGKVKLYTRDTPLYEEFGIQQEIEKALKPKVWLKSGGYIVINQTEALVAIDVNTGKYVGKTNRLEDTIVKTNVDAVNEIVRQVRLRDLGGIIVIDFIDMDERKNRAKVVQALEEALRSDRAPTKVISFNDFGLVAVTRKRVKQSLERTLCDPCSYCTGSGWVKSVNTVCNEILAEARKMAKGIDGDVLTLRVNPEVAKALKSREGGLVSELESMTKKDVIIKGDPSVHQERFEIY
jgi:ribonuclease G